MILMGDGSTNIIMGDSLKYDGSAGRYERKEIPGKQILAQSAL